jgi:hypothetical protein
MKRSSPASAALSLVVLLVAACGEQGAPTQAAPESPSFARSTNAPVHSVTGGGKVDWSSLSQAAGVETYGISASIDGNGIVKGQLQSSWNNPDVTFHANVTCLAVSGSDAWLGLVVTRTHDEVAFPVGTQGVMRVRDNGQGADAVPDELGYWVLISASRCGEKLTTGVFATLLPWVRGNLQVN